MAYGRVTFTPDGPGQPAADDPRSRPEDPAADVDEVRVALHLPELRPAEHPRQLWRVRRRDHDVVILSHQLRQPLNAPECRNLRGSVDRPRGFDMIIANQGDRHAP
jgi:hypothetical protein